MSVLSANLAIAEGDYAWTGSLELGDLASYQTVQVGDSITIELGGETFSMMVDNKTLNRNGVSRPQMVLSVISPTARFAFPLAKPMEKAWVTATTSKTAAEEAVGESIHWDLVDWAIPAERLSVFDASPIEVVRTIAETAGGLVETLPNGSLRVRHRFPVAVPQWDRTVVDHVLTDADDNLSSQESYVTRERINRVAVRGYLPANGNLSIQIDSRSDGLNRGRTVFYGGTTAHFLVHADPTISNIGISSSSGSIFHNADQSYQITQDIVFDNSNRTRLSQPVSTIDSVIWVGTDLGSLSLEADGDTVTAVSSGVAIARITCTIHAQSCGLTLPKTVAGLDSFPITVQATGHSGEQVGAGQIICQRGDGEFIGSDISNPLLSTTGAMLSRGRAEIDSGEGLQEVSLTCIFIPGIMPGQLVEVHDAMMGRSWRGKVTSVGHEVNGVVLTTALELIRHVIG
ncbi:MAG: hypothetical protein HQL67_11545 [Magnetococcales bacterium]|nr:hypothetical protein [Magnetococcales bacterium]